MSVLDEFNGDVGYGSPSEALPKDEQNVDKNIIQGRTLSFPESMMAGIQDPMDVPEGAIQCASHDPVNHPAHYTTGNIETIDFIQNKGLNFARGNAVKYIVRAGLKDPNKTIEDLKKAIWYINAEIHDIERRK